MKYSINPKLCSGCGNCLEACPQSAIFMVDGTAQIDENCCNGCGACMQACPNGAIIPQQQAIATKPKPDPVESGFKKTIIALGSTLVSLAVSHFLSNLDEKKTRNQDSPVLQENDGKGRGPGKGNGGERRRRRGRNR